MDTENLRVDLSGRKLSMFKLRPYQLEELNKIYSSFDKGNRSIIVQSPP